MPRGAARRGGSPRADDRSRVVRVVPAHERGVGGKQPPGLRGDRGEHLLPRRRPGHQRRHPAQRRLLLGEPAQLHARLGAGDRGRGQLGEPGQPLLGIRWQGLLAGGCQAHHAPQPALNADRRGDGRADTRTRGRPRRPHPRRRRSRRGAPHGPSRPPACARCALQAHPGAAWDGSAGAAPRGDHPYRAVGAVPAHRRVAGAQQPPGLLSNRREHLTRRRRPGHQHRHPAQGGLLLGDPVLPGSPRRASRHIECTPSAVPVPGRPSVGRRMGWTIAPCWRRQMARSAAGPSEPALGGSHAASLPGVGAAAHSRKKPNLERPRGHPRRTADGGGQRAPRVMLRPAAGQRLLRHFEAVHGRPGPR